ncbi:tyrosine-protein phosphatase [Agrococcus jejuensis]|uniref:Protein tyrosine/serine phosphatase n=1 Tax=Agrococcus jejuensis TaxID=399736 RepID=A0A1G8EDJ5_9MICO|nr:tyrosine-protein phosphatase [Agrococcus jejuensis]SDH67973.1 Protein tyrosine/serine phosphatase [Agrococcus jejuensis]
MRDLDWDGLRNVRDLGGLPTSLSPTGATFPRRVARGPRRELLTTAGWDAAAAWGVRAIVDLRSADEVGRRESDPDATVPEAVVVTLAPTEDQAHPEFRAVCMPILDSPEYWRHNVRILPGLLRATLEAIAASEPGVLVHCAAGRDRTGMVSAILLAHAGVAPADVLADYAASVRAMAGTAAHGGPTHDRQARWTPAETDAFLADVAPHVLAFAVDVEAVLDELAVAASTRDRLRALLTDPAGAEI